MPLKNFHPTIQSWFERNLGKPTEAQVQAWPAIKKGRHTLIAAPTGSGKTLAAFYAVIDTLVTKGLDGKLPEQTQVVYVSPLKALSNDIHRNLEVPLTGIQEVLREQGLPPVKISVAVRTGDTSPYDRQKMVKHPPHILVTTPESLYLLLTSASGREMLRSTRIFIIDEIHALIGDKRGSHLALSVERLEALTDAPLQRIGLSATQKPIETVAKFLVGNPNIHDGRPDCAVIDAGHRRKLDLSLEVPRSPLTAVMSNEVWTELYERLVELIQAHKTTLIFVNTRRLTERLAIALSERIGEAHVSSHHGSMSKEHRHNAEQRLKSGRLKVLVATASMELGIDIGAVDLVVQFSSPKSIAAFLQRVGRSGHYVGGIPKGILFPLSRDDLIECAALLDSVRRGELDEITLPEEPLDILAQQIVAEVASGEWAVDLLYDLLHHAYPYRKLSKERFLEIVRMVADGFTTRRGRRGAHLHYDTVNGRVRARRGARLTALTNGGAIPDMFDYEVVMQPEGITVGSLNEDYALESLPGDIFTLGTHAWQLLRIEGLKVMVKDANGLPPTIPFWFGEGPGRTPELSESISRMREIISEKLAKDPIPKQGDESPVSIRENGSVRWLVEEVGISESAAVQMVSYLAMGEIGLGVMPTRKTIVLERFFDEAGDMHLVIHSPYGSRVNKGWGLALRKKFCVKFNFELQAAANEDSIILSLSSSHSFPLEEVFAYLNTKILRDTLIQAMLIAPMFEVRWRWNATRALAISRNRSGKRVPPPLQRMQAEDLVAQLFPDQIACAENIGARRELPDHPLVDQVIHDCLTEAMDIDALEELIGKVERKELRLVTKDLREPSPFAREIINARPYAFLDDIEFAERRVNAIRNRSWLDPSEAADLSRLDPEAIKRVKEEAWPEARDADELHDALLIYGFISEAEGRAKDWEGFFYELLTECRSTRLLIRTDFVLWVATERVPLFKSVFQSAVFDPEFDLPDGIQQERWDRENALKEIIRGRLESLGPVTVAQLAEQIGISEKEITETLVVLETEGFVFRGCFTPDLGREEWCERRLLQRIHKYTIESLRRSIEPVSLQDFIRFLFTHHKMGPDMRPTGPESLQKVLGQLEGISVPAAAWETDIIPARLAKYDPNWLDGLCLSGHVLWGRLSPPKQTFDHRKRTGPVKSTPLCLVARRHLTLWRSMVTHNSRGRGLSSTAQSILTQLEENGASFFEDILAKTHLLKSQVEEGIAELVADGSVSNDSYSGLRAILTPSYNRPSQNGGRKKRKAVFGIEHAGRWFLIPEGHEDEKERFSFENLGALVLIYLKRWGVVFRSLLEKESFSPPWRVLVRVLRRLELRGVVRGGRFVSNASGEQFALPETVESLRKIRKEKRTGEYISISAADPLNLLGILLPGKKIPNITRNRILFRDGIPIAVLEGKKTVFLKALPAVEQWAAQKALVRSEFPPQLRAYLGKSFRT
ncbi:MAG: DEAD/DEAH box helicase [Nitrospiria bacterium]